MKVLKRIKRKMGLLSNNPFLCKINLILFHMKERAHIIHPGNNNPEEKYMIIRPMDKTQGLLSTYFYVMNNVKWAKINGYIPFVDFETQKCQYYTGREIFGTKNAWEYFFCQPSAVTKGEVYEMKNVLLSGWSNDRRFAVKQIRQTTIEMKNPETISIVKAIPVKQYIYEIAQKKFNELFNGKVLGVFMRGTDYVKLKPKGHAIQPTISQVMEKIDEFVERYPIDRIYVVTEDYNYFSSLKERYGDRVCSADNYFIKDYHTSDYIESSFDNDPYERGLNYLVRILLLNKCNYLISGITNGSLVSCCWREKPFEDEYWFDLGNY